MVLAETSKKRKQVDDPPVPTGANTASSTAVVKDRPVEAGVRAIKVEGSAFVATAASVAVIEGNIVPAPTAEAASQGKIGEGSTGLSITVTASLSRHIAEIAKLFTLTGSADPEKSEMATTALRNMGVVDEDNNINVVKPETISDVVNLLKSGRVLDKEYALIVLEFLTRKNEHQISFAAAGVIPVLVSLLKLGTAVDMENAAGALWNLARNNDNNKIIIAAAGAIPPLVELVKSGTAEGKEKAVGALNNLARNEANQITIAAAGAIPPLVELVRSGTPKGKENAAAALWNLACNDANQITVAAAGAIPVLVSLLKSGTEVGKLKAAGALANLASNDTNKTFMEAAGVIPVLVSLAMSGTAEGKEIVARALSNLACNDASKISIAAAGAIPVLVSLLKSGTELGKEYAVGALSFLAKNKENSKSIVDAAALPVLIDVLKTGSPKTKKYAIDLLSKLSVDHARAVIAAAAIPALVNAAQSCSADVQSVIPRIFANLALNDHSAQIALLMHGALPLLVAIARSGTDNGKAEAAAALAVLAADVKGAQGQVVTSNAPHRVFIVAEGAIPALINLARSGNTARAKGQAARALSELAIDDVNKLSMIDAGAVPVLVDLLRSGTHTSPFINQTAEAIYNLAVKNEDVQAQLAAAGIIPVLEALENPSVRVARITELLAILRKSNRVRQAIGGLAF